MRATLTDLQVAIQPGVPSSVDVELVNTESAIDGVAVSVRGIDQAFVRVEPPLLALFPTTSATVRVTFDLPKTFPSGDTPVLVVATSTVDPSRNIERDVLLHVGEVHGARVEMRPEVVTGGRRARFIAHVHNTGNTFDDVRVSATESSRTLQCRVTPPIQGVEARQSSPFFIDVFGKRPWFGQVTTRSINVVVETDTDQLETAARFQQKPRIPWGAITALVLAMIIALWAAIFIFVIGWMRSDSGREKAVPESWNAHGVRELPLDTVAASIGGEVTAATTGQPLPRITVEAFRLKTTADGTTVEPAGSAATDEEGTYTLAALLPGRYQLRFSANGYDPIWYPASADQAAGEVLAIAPLDALTGKNVVISGKPGALRGSIALPPGANAAVPATVTVSLVPQSPNDPVPPPMVISTTGAFDFSGLPTPATYSISVERPGFDTQTFTVSLAGGESPPIQPDQMRAAPGGVSGTVTAAGGAPLGGVTVTLRGGTTELVSTTPTVGPVGSFSMTNLPTPGTYVLTFEKAGYAPTTIALDLTGGASRDGLVAVLQGGVGTVSGTVGDPFGNPLGGVIIAASGSSTASTSSLTAGDGTSGAGSYTMSGLVSPGNYTLAFTLAGYEPATIPVNLDGVGALSGVDVVMRPSSGRVLGTVTINGAAADGVAIELTDGNNKQSTLSSSSPLGGYEFIGVKPGDYTVVATGKVGDDSRRVVVLTHVAAGDAVIIDLDIANGARG